jgi:ATP-dependent Lon protease
MTSRSCWSRRRAPPGRSRKPDGHLRSAPSRTILQLLKLPDGTVKVLVEGGQRARSTKLVENPASSRPEPSDHERGRGDRARWRRWPRSVVEQFEQYVKLNKKIPPEMLVSLSQASTMPAAWPTPSPRT